MIVLMKFSLKGKVAIVSGATKGLGYGMSRALAGAGADLVIVSRNKRDCERVAAEIKDMGRLALPVAADIRDLSMIDTIVNETVNHFKKIDILINNAGAAVTKPPEQMDEGEWDHVVDLNLKGAFFMAQRVGKQMIRQKHGKIINVASAFGFIGDGNLVSYCASKGGLLQMTRSLAVAWARYNIQVNAIAPGYIQTDINKKVLAQEKVLNHLLRKIPARRLGAVDDLLGAVVYMSSPASDYMTGQTVVVDGGMIAG